MKSLIALSLLVLSLSSFADVSISGPSIEVKYGGGLAAVQPTAYLSFKFASCARFNLNVDQQEKENGIVELTVQIPADQMDCMGPSTLRAYNLQLSSDYRGERYSVTNPLIPNTK